MCSVYYTTTQSIILKIHDSHLGERLKPLMANHFDNNKEMEGQKKVQKKKLSFNWANWSKLPQMVHNFQL